MKKTLGQELYELLNPHDPSACANPAQWHETDEDFQDHYERCASKHHNAIVGKCASVVNGYLHDGDWDTDTAEAIMHGILDLKAGSEA